MKEYAFMTKENLNTNESRLVDAFLNKNNLGSTNVFEEIIVCFYKSNPIGIASYHFNFLHPFSRNFFIYVDENYRCLGIGSQLVTLLKKEEQALRIGVMENKEVFLSFLEKHKFYPEVKSLIPTYSFNEMILGKQNISGYGYESFSTLSIEEIERIKKANFENYKTGHFYNPVSTTVSQSAFSDIALREMSDKYSFAIKKNNSIVGYCINFVSSENKLEVGYLGTVSQDDNNSEIICVYNNLFIELFITFLELEFEIDDNDDFGLSILKLFKETNYEKWIVSFYRPVQFFLKKSVFEEVP